MGGKYKFILLLAIFQRINQVYALGLLTLALIQETSLLDYALTHKTVNSALYSETKASYGLTANSDDTYIIDTHKVPSRSQDLYTSDEQRRRDQYEIDEDNWHEVAFEEVNGNSTCRLALHNDWIINHGYVVDGIVAMNLPEQGISGPFKITAIKHILPQKKPVDEDPDDEWEYKPVTGLFIHRSDQVPTLAFASADDSQVETLGVTAAHPIFSATHQDWRLAGELEAGEKVLTYKGEATVISNERKPGNEFVYNLEVKDLHNFLVGDRGVVVHNACAKTYFGKNYDELLRNLKSSGELTHSEAVEELEKLAKAAQDKIIELGEPLTKAITNEIRVASKDFANKMTDELLYQLGNTATEVITEVTFTVILNSGAEYEIRPDAVVDNSQGGIDIGEAKYTTDDSKDWDKKYRSSMTDHQRKFEDDFKANNVKHIIPKGPNTKLAKVNLSKGVPVTMSQIKSYRIFGSNKAKIKVWQKRLF